MCILCRTTASILSKSFVVKPAIKSSAPLSIFTSECLFFSFAPFSPTHNVPLSLFCSPDEKTAKLGHLKLALSVWQVLAPVLRAGSSHAQCQCLASAGPKRLICHTVSLLQRRGTSCGPRMVSIMNTVCV